MSYHTLFGYCIVKVDEERYYVYKRGISSFFGIYELTNQVIGCPCGRSVEEAEGNLKHFLKEQNFKEVRVKNI